LTITTIAANGCADGYFLKTDGTKCTACGDNALKCSSETLISSC